MRDGREVPDGHKHCARRGETKTRSESGDNGARRATIVSRENKIKKPVASGTICSATAMASPRTTSSACSPVRAGSAPSAGPSPARSSTTATRPSRSGAFSVSTAANRRSRIKCIIRPVGRCRVSPGRRWCARPDPDLLRHNVACDATKGLWGKQPIYLGLRAWNSSKGSSISIPNRGSSRRC